MLSFLARRADSSRLRYWFGRFSIERVTRRCLLSSPGGVFSSISGPNQVDSGATGVPLSGVRPFGVATANGFFEIRHHHSVDLRHSCLPLCRGSGFKGTRSPATCRRTIGRTEDERRLRASITKGSPEVLSRARVSTRWSRWW